MFFRPRLGRQALFVPMRKFFSAGGGHTVRAFDNGQNQAELQAIESFLPGDYVYYVDVDGTAHGLMIVGHGPAIWWSDFLQADVADKSLGEYLAWGWGYQFWLPDEIKQTIPLDYEEFPAREAKKVRDITDLLAARAGLQSITVPYVVDWWDQDARRQGPRPFYATRMPGVRTNGEPQSTHSYWLFVPAPDSVDVLCDYAYELNCEDAWLYVNILAVVDAEGSLSDMIRIDLPPP